MSLFCSIDKVQATEKISPYIGLGSDAFNFAIDGFTATQDRLEYEPNIPGLVRFGISAFGLGASISSRGSTEELPPEKGESEFFDAQLSYNNKKWGVDLYVQEYQGFYLKNSSQVGGTSSYYLYPDLTFDHYGLMGRLALDNKGFSISGLLNQSDEITKTAGSYFLVGGFRHYSFESGISLVPGPVQGINLKMDKLRNLSSSTINLGAGAGKYWVSSSKLFIGAVLDILGTYGLYKYKLTDDQYSNDYGTLSYSLKVGAGYAGKKWRSGISAYGDTTTLQAPDKTFIKPQAISFLFYLRYVFN